MNTKRKITNKLTQVNSEIAAHDKIKPEEVIKPEPSQNPEEKQKIDELNSKIDNLETEIRGLAESIKTKTDSKATKNITKATLDKAISQCDLIQENFNSDRRVLSSLLQDINVKVDDIVILNLNKNPLNDLLVTIEKELESLTESLDLENPESLVSQNAIKEDEKSKLETELNEPNKKYQEYLEALKAWKKQRDKLIGAPDEQATAIL